MWWIIGAIVIVGVIWLLLRAGTEPGQSNSSSSENVSGGDSEPDRDESQNYPVCNQEGNCSWK